jgi:hypothetical protein
MGVNESVTLGKLLAEAGPAAGWIVAVLLGACVAYLVLNWVPGKLHASLLADLKELADGLAANTTATEVAVALLKVYLTGGGKP